MRTSIEVLNDFLDRTIEEWEQYIAYITVVRDKHVNNGYTLYANGKPIGRVLYIRDIPQVITKMTPKQAGF